MTTISEDSSQIQSGANRERLLGFRAEFWIALTACALSAASTAYYFFQGNIVAYGDAESHLNIAKRVIDSLTPSAAQLGGIWLPLPHILLIPFVYSDQLWRTGLAGSIVSGAAYIVTSVYLYKLAYLITKKSSAGIVAAAVFMLNPNVLYLQSTPMTELTLIVFFILSSYYFVAYLQKNEILPLLLSAFFGFCAALSRYDGWFLVGIEALILVLVQFPYRISWKNIFAAKSLYRIKTWVALNTERQGATFKDAWYEMEGKTLLFATLAFLSIILWLAWDALILGDPLYFTHSQFSAKSQQQGWLARGELPSYKSLASSFVYYFVTSMSNAGAYIFALAIIGFIAFLVSRHKQRSFLISLLMLVPFIFYVVTLYMGQSVIFIPQLTPSSFEWRLFNVRYGVIMLPVVGLFVGYLYSILKSWGKTAAGLVIAVQLAIFGFGYAPTVALQDGTVGLSAAKKQDAEEWMRSNYDSGLVLLDDYARTMSITRSNLPMKNVIYIGNKPYWEESLKEPEKYATWVVLQKNDAVWTSLFENSVQQGRLYKYFTKVYTSPDILIFKRTSDVARH